MGIEENTLSHLFSLVVAAAVLLGGVSHLAVLAAWHFAVLPDLVRSRAPERLSAAFAHALPTVRSDWSLVEIPDARIRLPARSSTATTPLTCAYRCELPLAQGRLRVGPHTRSETYWETVRLLAPDREDVAFRHPPWRNWSAMLALSRYVLQPRGPAATWRFETRRSHGVVTTHTNNGVLRHVVYAYAYDGRPGPTLLFSRVPTDRLLEMLASLEIGPVRPDVE